MTTVANLLKTLRNYAGINQTTIAEALFIRRSTYAKIEQEKTALTVQLALKIAKFYGLKFHHLAQCLENEVHLNSILTKRKVSKRFIKS